MAYLLQEQLSIKIKEAREDANLSQQELAEAIGMSDKSIVYRFEHNRRNVSLEVLEKIANVTSKPIPWFFGDSDARKTPILSKEEQHLIDVFRSTNEAGKKHLLNCADYIASVLKCSGNGGNGGNET